MGMANTGVRKTVKRLMPKVCYLGEDLSFDDNIGLAQLMAENERAQLCFLSQWFEGALARSASVGTEKCSVAQLQEKYIGSNLDLKEMMRAVTQSDSFLHINTESN